MCEREKAFYSKFIKKLLTEIESYIQQLPCLTFNGSSYDINLVKKNLLTRLGLTAKDNQGYVIKKNSKFMCISTPELRFLDISQYLSPGVSYDKFLKAYGTELTKSFFPYEWFDSVEKLEHDRLTDYDCFFSKLKRCNVLEKEYKDYVESRHTGTPPPTGEEYYARLQQVWRENNMQTFRDYLRHYNNLDVEPFIEAVDKMLMIYGEKGIDIFKDSISVPGVAKRLLFESCPEGTKFARFSKKNADLHKLLRNNIVGGPSIIFNRHQEANKTFIRGNKDKPCKRIMGYDANALYVSCLSYEMPTCTPIIRRRKNQFKPDTWSDYRASTSNAANEWLRHLELECGIKLQTGYNGPEKRIAMYLVDGYCAETKTAYEFNGCYWHFCKCQQKKSPAAEKRRQQTAEKKMTLENLGYKVVTMWECDWKKQRPTQPANSQGMTEKELLEKVLNDSLFGMIQCDLDIPDEKMEYFSEMSPIFKTCDVKIGDIGDHMASVEETQTKTRRLLVGGMKAKGILLASPLLKFYIKHGMDVSNVQLFIQYTPQKCFSSFTDTVTTSRRAADANPSTKILADTNKLIGNSAYGVVLMRTDKHRRIKYLTESSKLAAEFNKSSFTRFEMFDDNLFEVQHAKSRVVHDLPLQIGFFILQYAKLRLLEFYYDFLDYFIDRSDFQFICCDTDSAYMALSDSSLRNVVKPHLLKEFDDSLNDHCGEHDYNPSLQNAMPFLQRNCCDRDELHDARTPGIFKVECTGDGIVALSSKTYCVKTSNLPKVSCKGINKSTLDNSSVYTMYKNVLLTKISESCVNRGIRLLNNNMVTYEQKRCGFRYSYWKRKLLADGVSTEPLSIYL